MNVFDELESLYNEIDQNYSSVEFEARAKGWHVKEAKYTRKRNLNDQAYFLFMFSRLEDHIRTESANLICGKKTKINSWKQRAAWDILPSSAGNSQLPFKKRLALLVEKGSSDFNLIVDYS